MIIKTLVENTAVSEDFKTEHGLSLYLESNDHKILFDLGQGQLFLENAKKMDVSIEDVDYLVISHGHYDHGGGLANFFQENTRAEVFMHKLAFGSYYSLRGNDQFQYAGLDQDLKQNKQIVYTSDRFTIAKGIQVFSGVMGEAKLPQSNKTLYMKDQGEMVHDTFAHEQNLIIEENGKIILLAGCAHNGIINIVDHFYQMKGRMPDYVIGGFHLSSRTSGNEPRQEIEKIGKYLLQTKAKYYTCHCTGLAAYDYLKEIMADKIDYLATGSELIL